MENLLKENQKVCIVPNDIKGALSSTIKSIENDVIVLEINEEDISFYTENEIVEVFTVVDDGMLYFKPKVCGVNNEQKILKIAFNKEDYDLLQRREYTRVYVEKEFTLKDGDKDYICKTIDISAGGMKIFTDAPLSHEKDYEIEFSLENNIPLQCFFKPIRIQEVLEKNKPAGTIVSGKFIALKNIDKIAIVQFCFKKQMEDTNK